MTSDTISSRNAILIYISLFKLVLLLIFADNYGIFRDEFYYIACSKNLAWGFVDQPPLSALILAVSRFIFGDSIFGIRVFAYLAGSAAVFVSGLLAREMNGGRFAEVLTAFTVIFSAVLIANSSYFSMNAFDILLTSVFFYLLTKLLNHYDPKLWLTIGLVIGIGLMNKLTFLFLSFGLFIGLLLTNQRKYFLNKTLWLAAAIALLIFLPNIIWQITHDFPTLEFMTNATERKNQPLSPVEFSTGVLMNLNFGFIPLLLTAFYFLFVNKIGRHYILIGWIFLTVFLVFMVSNGKPYYMGVLFPVIFAAGGVGLEILINRFIRKKIIAQVTVLILLIPACVLVTPFVLPVLSIDDYIKYQEAVGLKPSSGERSETGVLPQFYADRFGWEEMVQTVAEIYNQLPEEEKERAVIIGDNYGEAGAIDYYGSKYNLPNAISTHNNYWYWGNDPKYNTDVYVILDITREEALYFFEEVEFGASHYHPLGKPDENIDIYICRKPRKPLSEIWRSVKNFI